MTAIAIVLVNEHEPHGEVAARLLELAEEKDYAPRVVEAQRGEHDAALSFRVPQDVADAFNADRADRWPVAEEEAVPDEGTVPDEPAADNDPTPPDRKARTGKAQNA
jgi:hypothetical protein